MMKIKKESEGPKRLDQFLIKKLIKPSRSFIQKMIKEGRVLVNDQIKPAGYIVKEGDNIDIDLKEKKEVKKQKGKIVIVYEDKDLLVVDKPTDLIVYPASGKEKTSVFDTLRDKINIKGERAGIVHRLDKETSGLMVIAKEKEAEIFLKEQFKSRKVEKGYLALVYGHIVPKKGRINIPIERGREERVKRFVGEEGKEAVTLYEVKEYIEHGKDSFTLVDVRILTGRTHQIRVHFQAIGYPLVGENFYITKDLLKKNQKIGLKRQFLHSYFLSFTHPNGQRMDFNSGLTEELKKILSKIKE